MLLQLGCMGFQKPSSTVQPVGETSAQTDAATQAQALALQLEAMQRQGADILEQVKAMSDRLSQLTVREAELRAVLEREAELQTVPGASDEGARQRTHSRKRERRYRSR